MSLNWGTAAPSPDGSPTPAPTSAPTSAPTGGPSSVCPGDPGCPRRPGPDGLCWHHAATEEQVAPPGTVSPLGLPVLAGASLPPWSRVLAAIRGDATRADRR